jgi:hypothetical protein
VFDNNLSFNEQISSVCKSCNWHIRDLRRIRRTLNFSTAQTIAHSLTHTKLDYCNSLYSNLPAHQITRLQHIQNSLARAVCRVPKYNHITPYLKSLHWLKIRERINYKLLSITYNLLQHHQPSYLRFLINVKPPGSTRSTSSITLCRQSPVSCKLSDRSFFYSIPRLWNSLPDQLRHPSSQSYNNSTLQPLLSTSRNLFLSRLKTHLFTHSYPP